MENDGGRNDPLYDVLVGRLHVKLAQFRGVERAEGRVIATSDQRRV